MFSSGINKQRKFQRSHYYLEKELISKIKERAQKENLTMSKVVSKILQQELNKNESNKKR